MARHGVSEGEAIEVIESAPEVQHYRDGRIVALGRTAEGRFLRVVYRIRAGTGTIFVITALYPGPTAYVWGLARAKAQKAMNRNTADESEWTDEKIAAVAAHYDNQTDEEAAAEDEAYFNDPRYRFVRVPRELVDEVETLVAEFESRKAS